jgi:hypothetical protein
MYLRIIGTQRAKRRPGSQFGETFQEDDAIRRRGSEVRAGRFPVEFSVHCDYDRRNIVYVLRPLFHSLQERLSKVNKK